MYACKGKSENICFAYVVPKGFCGELTKYFRNQMSWMIGFSIDSVFLVNTVLFRLVIQRSAFASGQNMGI